LFLTIFVLALLPACGTRTVLVKPGDPVRIRKPVKAAVWVRDAKGVETPGELTLPEGWYALPDPGDGK
jgi:hypothetical protein